INCNFTGNTATRGGAVYFLGTGDVRNCNFTGNNATRGDGGAVYFKNAGNVINCNFTGNNATRGGAVYFVGTGDVINCNFTGNTATRGDGGAVYFSSSGTVSNCNFTGNNATTGSAIYFYSTSAQKSVSNSIFLNNRANAKDLQVTKNENNITIIFIGNNNLLNAIYSNGDVSFSNVTYWGANGIVNTDTHRPSISNNAAGQNITVSIVINDKIVSNEVYVTDENGTFVLNRNVGDNYFIGVCHDTDSYYTEILNATSNNIKFSVNVNNQTSNNRRVNITAKSNIPNEVIKGKLLFILPNSTQINANYTANGTWWAVHEFDDAGDYDINASYSGLDGVIINNATISIRYDASVTVNNNTLDLFVEDTFTIVANTTPKGLNVTYVPDDSGVYDVDKSGVVTALKNGTGSVLVKIGGDGVYAENSTIVTVTVTKVPTEIKVTNTTLNLEVNDEIPTGATLSPDDAGNLTYDLSNDGIVKIEDGEIIALKEGNVTITVSFKGNNKYLAAENKTINVTVSLKNVRVSVNNNTLDLFVDDTFTIVANTTPKGLKVTYKPDNSGIISVDENGVVTALKEGNTTIIVSVGDNKVYAENTTTVTVTVRKIPTEILITNETLDLKVNDKVDSGAGLNPSEAGNLTYTISETSIIKLLD
ncbi:Ig-like domain-containing protein, partial [Methanobrevibacter sp.]|uniref:Ig-like domain-containing protein n=1 Tax=Methanobrevibacter sp. TaxID=66852 RepID=UPI002E775C2C